MNQKELWIVTIFICVMVILGLSAYIIVSNNSNRPITEQTTTNDIVEPTTNVPVATGFIMSDSNTKIIKEADIKGKPDMTIRLIKNEILARHGYVFSNDEVMRNYFANQNWYIPDASFTMDNLSEIERYNFNFLNNYLANMEKQNKAEQEKIEKDKDNEKEDSKTVVIYKDPTPTPVYNSTTMYCCASDYATLRSRASTQSSAITRIYSRARVECLGSYGSFYYVSYNGYKGYVLSKFFSTDLYAPLNYDAR